MQSNRAVTIGPAPALPPLTEVDVAAIEAGLRAGADQVALDGIHGLVLAAETAVGVDPVGTVDTVLRSIRAFEASTARAILRKDRVQAAS